MRLKMVPGTVFLYGEKRCLAPFLVDKKCWFLLKLRRLRLEVRKFQIGKVQLYELKIELKIN